MNARPRARSVLAILAAGMVGYLIGPPIVHAVTDTVILKDYSNSNQARVGADHRLRVDSEAGLNGTGDFLNTFGYTIPNGAGALVTNDSATLRTVPGTGIITGIVVDNPPGTGSTLTITVSTSSDVLWRGTAQEGEHFADDLSGGIFYGSQLSVAATATGTPGPTFRFVVYGYRLTTLGPAGVHLHAP